MNGIITWFVRNPVAANIMMVGIIAAGIWSVKNELTLEVFPTFDIRSISVSVSYRGATPREVEENIVARIEEAVWDLEGIEDLEATASEGRGTVSLVVRTGYDPRRLLDDVKNRVDAINTLPEDAEKPEISLSQGVYAVLMLAISGDLTELALRRKAEQVRDELASLPGVTQVNLAGVRPFEIAIELKEEVLQKYGLTLDQVAAAIRRSSVDVPAGSIRTRGGEVLLRTKGQAYRGEEFAAIEVLSQADGRRITLGEIADVRDGFDENHVNVRFNGKPSAMVMVSRVGDQSALEVARTVKDYIANRRAEQGVEVGVWMDQSKPVEGRLKSLLQSAWMGLLLVLLVLTLFLRPSLALWVCVGMVVAVSGALFLLPIFGYTLNLISMFAFILVLGIVVDDAIVTGESIYSTIQAEGSGVASAIKGTNLVAVPVTFGVITTMVAFMPLAMIPGGRGVMFGQIPPVVIGVLLFSIIESKFILPSHLRHLKPEKESRFKPLRMLMKGQRAVARSMEWYAAKVYAPVLALCLRTRYFTITLFVVVLILFLGYFKGGRIAFTSFPRVESETAKATLSMPSGTDYAVTEKYIRKMETTAIQLQEKYIDPESEKSLIVGILASTGATGFSSGSPRGARITAGNPAVGEVAFELAPPEDRSIRISTMQVIGEWRQMIGPIPGAEGLNFRGEFGRTRDPIDVQLMGPDFGDLQTVAKALRERLSEFPEIVDLEDNFEDGKEEIQLTLKPEAELIGLTPVMLGQQVRAAFYGIEAQRIQRGRDDIRVMVRYPREQRERISSLEQMRIRTPQGAELPFSAVAEVNYGQGFNRIDRRNRQRIINVTGDYNKETTDEVAINRAIAELVPELVAQYPGMTFDLEGEQRERNESNRAFLLGILLVIGVIYILLAIPFRSYLQPLVVLSVIPFGLVGAVLGHMIMGKPLSMMSVFGMLALSGVVVNDSLVMVDYINQRRREGLSVFDAVRVSGQARFRAIILTSITTFAGLLPLLFEKATQAQFLIPMAISLGFGILFATLVTLVLVPLLYLVLEDIVWFWGAGKGVGSGMLDSRAEALDG